MPDQISSPVELGFSEFVAKLISDTFEAVVASGISQEKGWAQLEEILTLDMPDFIEAIVDEGMVEDEMARLFPDGKGGTVVARDLSYKKGDPDKGIREEPPIKALTGYQPRTRKLTASDVNAIRQAVKQSLGRQQFDVLNKIHSRGNTRVIVDAGKVNAKLNFEIQQVEEEGEERSRAGRPSATGTEARRIFAKHNFPGLGELARPVELRNIKFFVKPPTDKDPQTHQVKANVYGEVEIQFKTVT